MNTTTLAGANMSNVRCYSRTCEVDAVESIAEIRSMQIRATAGSITIPMSVRFCAQGAAFALQDGRILLIALVPSSAQHAPHQRGLQLANKNLTPMTASKNMLNHFLTSPVATRSESAFFP